MYWSSSGKGEMAGVEDEQSSEESWYFMRNLYLPPRSYHGLLSPLLTLIQPYSKLILTSGYLHIPFPLPRVPFLSFAYLTFLYQSSLTSTLSSYREAFPWPPNRSGYSHSLVPSYPITLFYCLHTQIMIKFVLLIYFLFMVWLLLTSLQNVSCMGLCFSLETLLSLSMFNP